MLYGTVLHILPGQELSQAEAGARLVAVARECLIYVGPGEDELQVQVDPLAFSPPAPESLTPVRRVGASGVGAMVRLTQAWLTQGSASEQAKFRGRMGVVSVILPNGMPEVTFPAFEEHKEERLRVGWNRLEVVLQP